jgi:hypothetical protein
LEDILGKLEQALELMMRYLPDDLLQEIRSTQTALQEAKTNLEQVLNNPDASPEQKAQARAQVREAKEALRNAYGNAASYWAGALADFVKIVWETIKELKNDIIKDTPIAIQNFNNKNLVVKEQIEPALTTEAPSDESLGGFVEVFYEIRTDEPTEPSLLKFKQDVLDLEQKRKAVYFIRATLMLVAYYIDMGAVEADFAKDEILNGQELMEFILQELKERKTEAVIIQNLKQKIRTKLEDFGEFLYKEEDKE